MRTTCVNFDIRRKSTPFWTNMVFYKITVEQLSLHNKLTDSSTLLCILLLIFCMVIIIINILYGYQWLLSQFPKFSLKQKIKYHIFKNLNSFPKHTIDNSKFISFNTKTLDYLNTFDILNSLFETKAISKNAIDIQTSMWFFLFWKHFSFVIIIKNTKNKQTPLF